jgi:hypothetical protein
LLNPIFFKVIKEECPEQAHHPPGSTDGNKPTHSPWPLSGPHSFLDLPGHHVKSLPCIFDQTIKGCRLIAFGALPKGRAGEPKPIYPPPYEALANIGYGRLLCFRQPACWILLVFTHDFEHLLLRNDEVSKKRLVKGQGGKPLRALKDGLQGLKHCVFGATMFVACNA